MDYLIEYNLTAGKYLKELKGRCVKVGPDSKRGMRWKKEYIMSDTYDVSDAYKKPSAGKKEAWKEFIMSSPMSFKWYKILSASTYTFTIGEEIFDAAEFRIYLHVVTKCGEFLTWWDLSGIRDGKVVDAYKAGKMFDDDGRMESEVIIKMDFDSSQKWHNVTPENIARFGIKGKYRAEHVFVQDILFSARRYISGERWIPSERTFMPMPPLVYNNKYIRGVFYSSPVSYLPGTEVYCGEFTKDLSCVCGGGIHFFLDRYSALDYFKEV